ncbi:hypothetical protein [Arsenophonus nasoniae]|uniref:Uncharacterized protein n=1 Tax=Arsenophonus nasoniae TaxID=638 RepID=A0AA95K4G8_9GAMM|nr:hypothetical protein [Arsenophonus nasoniae]WGM00035.1 hypothetical protein QE210_08955 [Arsenophonus nasoniae]
MNDLIKILQLYSPLISLLTFFLGLYIGNKHAIGRDKRQEFNARAEPIIDYFDYMQSWFEQRGFAGDNSPSSNQPSTSRPSAAR